MSVVLFVWLLVAVVVLLRQLMLLLVLALLVLLLLLLVVVLLLLLASSAKLRRSNFRFDLVCLLGLRLQNGPLHLHPDPSI